ncbi:hypothetical protein AgCh_009434 [Apium graveolens]
MSKPVGGTSSPGISIALIFITVGIGFKLSPAPSHQWTPGIKRELKPVPGGFLLPPPISSGLWGRSPGGGGSSVVGTPRKTTSSTTFSAISSKTTMEIHTTQPKKDDGELPEMGTKDFSRDLLQITGKLSRGKSLAGQTEIETIITAWTIRQENDSEFLQSGTMQLMKPCAMARIRRSQILFPIGTVDN